MRRGRAAVYSASASEEMAQGETLDQQGKRDFQVLKAVKATWERRAPLEKEEPVDLWGNKVLKDAMVSKALREPGD